MPEAYAFPEGQVHLWTGTATASAIVAFAQNTQAQIAYGWLEHQSVDGAYARHQTGQSVDVTFGALYTYDSTIVRMVLSATAMHLHLIQSSVNGSAGLFCYSGHVSGLAFAGNDGQPYAYTLTYHGTEFSAYGG